MNNIISNLIKIAEHSDKNPIVFEEYIVLFFEDLICSVFSDFLYAYNKKLVAEYKDRGWEIDRIEKRTVQFLFGPVTFKRHRMRKEGHSSILPLDEALGFESRSGYSEALQLNLAKSASEMPFRKAADIVKRFH